MRCQATASQRPQRVALKTVVDETVDDRIHATVAATAQIQKYHTIGLQV